MAFQTPDDEAVQSGFSTPDDEAVPQQGMLESAARGALRNVPLGQQAAAAIAPINPLSDKPTYGAELQHLTEAAEQGKQQNPISYGAGAVAGTVAPLAIPGAGEALEAAPMLGNAALGATQSLSDTNLTAPKGKDLVNALIAGGLGAGVGWGAGKLAGKAAPEAAKVAAPAEEAAALVERVAQESAAPLPAQTAPANGNIASVGGRAIPNKPVAPDFVPSADRVSASMISQGLGGTPKQQMKYILGKDPIKSLNDIGSWLQTADEGKPLVGLMDRPGELLSKIEGIHESAGKKIGAIADEVGDSISVNGHNITTPLREIMDNSYSSEAEHAIGKLADRIDKAYESGKLDFAALQKIKANFGKVAGASKDDVAGSAIKQSYGVLAQYMNDTVERYAQLINDPAKLAAYQKLKGDYTVTSHLLPILRYQEAKELMGGAAGHFSLRGLLGTIVGMFAQPAQIVRNAAVRSAPAAAAAVRAAAPTVTPVAQSAGMALGKLPQAAQLELSNALQDKFRKK